MRMNMQEEKGPSGILNNCYNGLAELGSGELDAQILRPAQRPCKWRVNLFQLIAVTERFVRFVTSYLETVVYQISMRGRRNT